MRIMEMDQSTFMPFHAAGQTQYSQGIRFAPHSQRDDRQVIFKGFCVKRTPGLHIKFEGIGFFLEFPGQKKRLPLASPPFFACIDLE
jgi:hypothetical protein